MIDIFRAKYKFLSNFYPCIVYYKGVTFPSNEHFYQAMKTKDKKEWLRMSRIYGAKKVKEEGRKIKVRKDWDLVKDKFMLEGLLSKFSNNSLKEKLIETYPRMLIEGNFWHDNYWGNCSCNNCSSIFGENKLGRLLMKVRKHYMRET